MVHSLKVREEYFCAVNNGNKTFEVRKYDRDFRVGDCLALNEINENGEYTGRHLVVRITYILADKEYCKPGYVIMGLALGPTQSDKKRGEKPDVPLIIEQDKNADRKTQTDMLANPDFPAPDTPAFAEERRRIPVTSKQLDEMAEICRHNSCGQCILYPLGCRWVNGRPRECIQQFVEVKED